MSALSIQPTYPIFTDIDGQPLEDGYIWIGQTNLDPQVNPINVYWDAALTQPAGQPIRTLGGYPSNSGTPARLYVNSDYSIRVMNKNGSVVYSAPQSTERFSSELVTFIQAGAGAVNRTAQSKMREFVSVQDFGAIAGDPLSDQNAFIAARDNGKAYITPFGEYYLPLSFDSLDTPIISLGATFDLDFPSTTYLRSFIDLGSKSIYRQSIRDPLEYTGTPTTYTYLKDLTSFDIRHQNGAGYQQFFTNDSGGRTSVPAIYIEGSSFSYGDMPGVSVHYGISRHPDWASISGSWTGANSVVLFDGQSTALTNNVNIYGAEWVLADNANDRVAANGLVLNFFRENGNPSNFGQYNTVWSGIRATSLGTYAADSAYLVLGKWNVGLDFSGANLSNKAAIALKTDDRIYFGVPGGTPPTKWWADTLSNNYQNFDGTKYNFVVNSTPSFSVAQSEITSTPVHKFISSFDVVSAGNISSTVGASGSASALPANPHNYLIIKIDGNNFKIPVYNP